MGQSHNSEWYQRDNMCQNHSGYPVVFDAVLAEFVIDFDTVYTPPYSFTNTP